MVVTPQELRKLADDRSPELSELFSRAVAEASNLAGDLERQVPPMAARDIRKERSQRLAGKRSLDTAHDLDLNSVEGLSATFLFDLATFLDGTLYKARRTLYVWERQARLNREQAREAKESLNKTASFAGSLTAVVDSADRSPIGRQLVTVLVDLIDSANSNLPVPRPPGMTDYLELAAWFASLLYVVLGVPYSFDDANHDGQHVVAELEYDPHWGDSFADALEVRGGVENLIGKLHQAAQADNSPDELSKLFTQHAKDGHRLFFGSDGGEREIPARPASVQGWVTDAASLLESVSDINAAAREFTADLGANPSPTGLSDALNKQLDRIDLDHLADPVIDNETDGDAKSKLAITAERLGDALSDVVTPGQIANVVTIAGGLATALKLSPGSWLLSVIIVLMLLMRRKQ